MFYASQAATGRSEGTGELFAAEIDGTLVQPDAGTDADAHYCADVRANSCSDVRANSCADLEAHSCSNIPVSACLRAPYPCTLWPARIMHLAAGRKSTLWT